MRMMIVALLLSAPAAAQEMPDPDALAEGATALASELAARAAERMLLADRLGAEVTGPDGAVVGTVADFVVIPGGNLVAAVIERPGGARIALPWEAVQAGLLAGRSVEVPFTGAELDGAEALQRLNTALGL